MAHSLTQLPSPVSGRRCARVVAFVGAGVSLLAFNSGAGFDTFVGFETILVVFVAFV